jgi:hypothetical protein
MALETDKKGMVFDKSKVQNRGKTRLTNKFAPIKLLR